jgi:hypothetical protein
MLSSTTRGLYELGQFRRRVTRDYGVGRLSWDDFYYITQLIEQIEAKLVELASETDQLNKDERPTTNVAS